MTNLLFYKVTVISQALWGAVVKTRYNQIVSFMKCKSKVYTPYFQASENAKLKLEIIL